ncbi:MAG: hypothetical protein ACFFAY_15325 [Promethearchaeota archaeon]
MLKEIFVIDNGILILHYTKDHTESDSDQAVLSSGFMSALRDFSKETRSELIESLETETEYLLFVPDPVSSKVIVGIFDRRAPQRVAKEALMRIRALISGTELPAIEGMQLSPELKSNLRKDIDHISTQLFGTEFMDTYMNELLDNRSDISLAFVVDSDDKEVVASFARPKPLFKKEQVSEFLLLHSTLLRTIQKLGVGEYYRYFALQSSEYSVAVCWSGKILGVTTGVMRASKDQVLEAAAKVCYHDSLESLAGVEGGAHVEYRAVLHENGNLDHDSEYDLTPMLGVFISTLTNNLDGFFRAVTRRSFETFEMVTQETPAKKLKLSKDSTDNSLSIELLRYE